tara:strand:+ start:116 stop:325 length:210 start_codon:yes stop_codon:yes gene_type:complete
MLRKHTPKRPMRRRLMLRRLTPKKRMQRKDTLRRVMKKKVGVYPFLEFVISSLIFVPFFKISSFFQYVY